KLSSTKLDQWAVQPPAWKLNVLKKLEEKITLEDSVQLAEFLANISSAVVTAQKDLNESSTKYVSELEQSNSRIPPSYFAIPSIKAEMKVGFSELTTRGVNVILFKNETQKKEYVESTVTFELVAAPPLPAPISPPAVAPTFVGPEEPRPGELPTGEGEPKTIPGAVEPEEELRDSMRLARAALFAAVARRGEAKKEVAKEKEGPAVAAPGKKKPVAKTARKAAKKSSKKTGAKKR